MTNSKNQSKISGNSIRERIIASKFKKILILEIISIVITFLAFVCIILCAVYLSAIDPKTDQYSVQGEQLLKVEPILIAFLVVGIVLLVLNYAIIPWWATKIAWSEYNNFGFVLSQCDPSRLKPNVKFFLGAKKKSSIFWYLFWFSFIGIVYNIYMGLETTYYKNKNNNSF